MLNRRHLRIKVLQSLYAYYQSKEEKYSKAEVEMMNSIDRIYDLYLYLMLSFGELNAIAIHRLEENKKKRIPSEEDLNPNLKFVNNELVKTIVDNTQLRLLSEDSKVNWVGDEHQEMFKKILVNIRESETFFEHMNNDKTGFEEDKAFLMTLFKIEIANSPLLYNFFEEKSIQWLDDIDLACAMVVKTIKGMEEGKELNVLSLHKDEQDERDFVRSLFRKTVSMDKENELLIDDLTKNWELDRIAKMDVILMKMAVTEFQIFQEIPTKVTLNEYIEISKFYSTPKSNGFINGILDKAIDALNKEEKIVKIGRGLIN